MEEQMKDLNFSFFFQFLHYYFFAGLLCPRRRGRNNRGEKHPVAD